MAGDLVTIYNAVRPSECTALLCRFFVRLSCNILQCASPLAVPPSWSALFSFDSGRLGILSYVFFFFNLLNQLLKSQISLISRIVVVVKEPLFQLDFIPQKDRTEHTLTIDNAVNIISIKYSIDHRILAVQRNNQSVDFLNIQESKCRQLNFPFEKLKFKFSDKLLLDCSTNFAQGLDVSADF